MLSRNESNSKRTGMAIAALASLAVAGPTHAQFNAIGNPFNPAGPTIGAPIGGGVLSNIGFGTGLNTGFGSFNLGFNSGFTLPLNANFNNQLSAFNTQRANPSTFLDFNSRLAQFNANRTATTSQFSAFNSALNVPGSNFEAPNATLFPATQNLLGNTFTQVNPSLNPLIVNGPISGTGFGNFNNFNALNPSATGFQTFNTLASGFGGAGVPVAAQVQNIARTTRERPVYNPTLPTAAQVAAAGQHAGFVATSNLNTTLPPAGAGYRIPLATAVPTYPITVLPPVGAGYRVPITASTAGFPALPPAGANYRIPLAPRVMIGGANTAFGSGMGTAPVVMGGRISR